MRRYELTPPGFTAELIGGVVYVACPLGREHGFSSADVIGWLVYYRARTPGIEALVDATTLMDELGVPQPDAQLRIRPEYGGQSRDEGKYVGGAPELVAEIARSTRSFDLGAKRDDYERAGVQEYLVVTLDPDKVLWYHRRGAKLVKVKPDRDGLYRSKAFPGLWLDPVGALEWRHRHGFRDPRPRPGLARARRLRRQAGQKGGTKTGRQMRNR